MNDTLLAVDGLVAGYGDSIILEDVSIELAARGSLALLGRNGVGKTTLIASLLGLTRIHRGTVAFAGADVTRWQPYARVVESWRHQFDARQIDRLDFLADGRLAGMGESTWSRTAGRLVLRWPDGRAPGGAWTDDCAGEKDGDAYDGWNQCGTHIVGTRIRD